MSSSLDPAFQAASEAAYLGPDIKGPNVMRENDISFFSFGKQAQSLRCADGPFNWPSLSHEIMTSQQYSLCMANYFSLEQFTTSKEVILGQTDC